MQRDAEQDHQDQGAHEAAEQDGLVDAGLLGLMPKVA